MTNLLRFRREATMTTTHRPATALLARGSGRGADRAFVLLRSLFTVAPIAFGADKFLGLLTDWDQYLAPWIDRLAPGTAHQAMLAVGVVEIVAGLVVALWPRYGGLLVAGWLAGIVVDLLTLGSFYDVALRDVGLLVAALALTALAWDRSPSGA